MKYNLVLTILCIALVCSTTNLSARGADTIFIKKGLVLPLVKGYAEVIVAPNPIEASIALDRWKIPKEGQRVRFSNGEERQWQLLTSDTSGWFEDTTLSNCYLYCEIEMNKQSIMILESMGNEMVYINGSPRSGNPYGLKDKWETWEPKFNYSLLPITLKKGKNELLFKCQRGKFKAMLYPPQKSISFNSRDVTIPDFITGTGIDCYGAIVVINSSHKTLKNLSIISSIYPNQNSEIDVPIIQPQSIRKIPFHLKGNPIQEKGNRIVYLTLKQQIENTTKILDTTTLQFRVVDKKDNHKETFISNIDGSVQYYGINPASDFEDKKPRALFLSLHGASVEAINQSSSYYPKTWGHIIAPTNRRPYGFNWEEWGRIDAIEVLDIVKKKYSIDENRIYLTGHSMGGHGVWHIGSLYPDQFAAIGPSAGWISFWTYRFRGQNILDTTEIRKMIRRSTTPSETFMHINNYTQLGIYILHGSDDDNVYPEQSRMMVEQLSKIHKDFIYNEQKGVGHWWDLSDEPGADCVDWVPMFDFFARHARPLKERIREITFTTSNPSISAKNNWITIDAQHEPCKTSSVSIRFDPGTKRFIGTTNNIERLAFDLDIMKIKDSVSIELDKQNIGKISIQNNQQTLWLENKLNKWIISSEPSPNVKNSKRYGPFKEAFRNRFIFVYGTHGSDEENKWAFEKARYDAEKFWYQGNGSIDIFADDEFEPLKFPNHNIIIYGNQNTNSAWNKLIKNSPVQVGNNFISIGGKKFTGSKLGCIFIRPRNGSDNSLIGVISGSGLTGMKLTTRIPYLSPGIGLPDLILFNSDIVTEGEKGVLVTGFFGLDWSVKNGDFIWNTK